ncbi:isocitrate lyase/phosphoenolpyruvate mutase family protein [Pikeienuella sp. HZG-20]|uniref:isocitrate lyase/PEP mutase family protein n=1 Tax=Paludibacillus litoralis TaxID=3133267 RepID=UPI0030EB3581
MSEASRKRERFRDLHKPGAPLLMANPWDIGSALVLKAKGAKAFGTTSAGHAFTLGRPDLGHVSRDEALAHAKAISEATGLPVSGDFENGYGDAPEFVAETVEMAAEAGLAGCSIEDTIAPSGDAYPFDVAMARAKAAIAAAKRHGLVLTVRADGVLTGRYDAAEGIRRCLAFAELGADVVYAPTLPAEGVKTLTASGARVNVLTTPDMAALGVAGIAALGAARISIGSTLARVAQRMTIEAGEAMFAGDLQPLIGGAGRAAVDEMLKG